MKVGPRARDGGQASDDQGTPDNWDGAGSKMGYLKEYMTSN